MSFLVPERRFDPTRPEMMDLPDADPHMLEEDLRNLRIINRLYGGLSLVRRAVLPHLRAHDGELTVLDLATGSADQPIAIARLARKMNRRVRIVAVDVNPRMLAISRERTKAYPEITVERGDLLDLRYDDRSFDLVICSLALHHFSEPDAVTILRSMGRIAREAFIVNELSRSRPAAWAAWLWTHVTTRNPMTLYDSYVSVLRAFTPAELSSLAQRAGIMRCTVLRRPWFRLLLTATC